MPGWNSLIAMMVIGLIGAVTLLVVLFVIEAFIDITASVLHTTRPERKNHDRD